MGSRRVSRKRLYQVEKQGISVDLEAAAGISGCVKSATQHRNGQEVITEIALDLAGPQTLEDGSATGGVIAEASKIGYITQLTVAKYGVITEIRGVVVEAISAEVSFALENNATRVEGATNPTEVSTAIDLNTLGEDKSEDYDNSANVNSLYLYLVQGGSGNTDAQITTGKLLIYIHGFIEPADL